MGMEIASSRPEAPASLELGARGPFADANPEELRLNALRHTFHPRLFWRFQQERGGQRDEIQDVACGIRHVLRGVACIRSDGG